MRFIRNYMKIPNNTNVRIWLNQSTYIMSFCEYLFTQPRLKDYHENGFGNAKKSGNVSWMALVITLDWNLGPTNISAATITFVWGTRFEKVEQKCILED